MSNDSLYFLKIAETIATRSKCLRAHVGAVAVKDKQILATGYNGPPRGMPHCVHPADINADEIVCKTCQGFGVVCSPESTREYSCGVCLESGFDEKALVAFHVCPRILKKIPSGTCIDECWAEHAERNCINQAARHGVSLLGADIYVTHQPCAECLKTMINSGISRVFYAKKAENKYNLRAEVLAKYIELVHVPDLVPVPHVAEHD